MSASKYFYQLQELLRQREIDQAKFDKDVLYEVYETNSDLEMCTVVFQSFVRDTAETVLVKFFKHHSGQKDYMLYNRKTQEMIAVLFSNRTKGLRNECLG